jgi:hypothetical protein
MKLNGIKNLAQKSHVLLSVGFAHVIFVLFSNSNFAEKFAENFSGGLFWIPESGLRNPH